ncbi:hypothetical protein BU26DRAFT_511795 [Trematosphaeria pertusa]|uniref:Uncharacterized protein n=1 Tax=Trematosphaeria pertusa TaxID=390896 RepID=A0A6A6HSK4_9PLEO|nr:uncharacterized protein BU26DRAFT_511795 [Trematosphaeria pertusa]KAF2240991.1 hypothetical protein BU26DRAFT_511795 [Trematosphaeria pertusa]
MPYLIHIPPSHNLTRTPTSLHPTLLPTPIALSSTTTLDRTLTRDFLSWGWRVQHLDTRTPSPSPSPSPSLQPQDHAHTSPQNPAPAPAIATASRRRAKKWHAAYQQLDAKYNWHAKAVKIWEKEHGRRIRERDRQGQLQGKGQGSKKGWKDKLKDWFLLSRGAENMPRKGGGGGEKSKSSSNSVKRRWSDSATAVNRSTASLAPSVEGRLNRLRRVRSDLDLRLERSRED